MTFDEAFTRLLGHEGEYSNNPRDPGGETMWGVTVAVARENGYRGKMMDMPRDVAKGIYRVKYWQTVLADSLPAPLRFDVFDAAVNSGPDQAIRWLQRAVQVADDGILGPVTLAAVLRQPNPEATAAAFNGHRLQFMTDLSRWPTFSRGWARRIASNLKRLGAQDGLS